MQGLTVIAPFLGILSLIIAWLIYGYVKKQPNGTPLMQELEEIIRYTRLIYQDLEHLKSVLRQITVLEWLPLILVSLGMHTSIILELAT